MKIVTLMSIICVARAALPPLPKTELISSASTIFGGLVTKLDSTVVNDNGEPEDSVIRGDHTKHRVVEAVIRVSFVNKTNHASIINVGLDVTVTYRHILLPQMMVGPQGQNEDLRVGSHVVLYTIDNAKQGPFQHSSAILSLIEPNGWEEDTFSSEIMSSPPKLSHSRWHGFKPDSPLTVIRTITKEECEWLDGDVLEGSEVYLFRGHTYGVVGDSGVAVTKIDGQGPFFELPAEALTQNYQI